MSSRVAVVLSGAAARGAFQAGALEVILPALEAQGHTPTIFIGTSAGAINAALWGQSAHLGYKAAGAQVVDTWSTMGREDVIAHPLRTLLLSGTPAFLSSSLGLGNGVTSIFDTSALADTAAEVLDGEQLAANVRDGTIDAVGVVATRLPPPGAEPTSQAPAHARTVVFLDSTLDTAAVADPVRGVDVAVGPVRPEHVLASAAIPIAFPPVRIEEPAPFRGWYSDGGVRLNTPLRPAVALEADRILVVSAMSTGADGPPQPPDEIGDTPTIADTGAAVLHSVLADQITEDLHTLRSINLRLARAATPEGVPGESDVEPGHRTIPVMVVSPSPGELGLLAEQCATRGRGPLGLWRSSDLYALNHLLRGLGDGPGRRELLSYVMFDESYFTAQIALGAAAAERALRDGWQLG
ncbi:MAG: patatin-like phospholipase family protein [Actinobacteria bacterium]|nr:patatin-like phospholipase family protein [Actinomycetota bacterium]